MNSLSSVIPAASVISLPQVAGGSRGVNHWKSPNDTSSSVEPVAQLVTIGNAQRLRVVKFYH